MLLKFSNIALFFGIIVDFFGGVDILGDETSVMN